jgi:GTPase SAR1 family protein
MDSYTIAVIGSAGAGKSTFIQRVLGLARRPISNSSSTRLAIDGVTYAVSLFELDLENFDQAASSQTIQWPKQINGHIVPKPDAALVLYDVMDQDSIRRLPKAMSMCTAVQPFAFTTDVSCVPQPL